MGLDDPCAASDDLQARNFYLACYAVSLVEGETIQTKKVRYSTLMGYIGQAVELHTQRNLPSPRSADIDFVRIITEAVRKYEKVPDRREMIHDAMYLEMVRLYKKYLPSDPDCLVVALCEWMFLGRYVGFRKSEWTHKHKTNFEKIDDPEWGDRPAALGLILEDITFYSASGRPVHVTKDMWHTRSLPTNFEYLKLRIRKQKNNDNYQILTYHRVRNSYLCPVRAAFMIYCRARHLDLPTEHPVAIYRDANSASRFQITGKDTNTFLRKIASYLYDIPETSEDLKKWSTHSVRVTAANLLHRAKFSDSYIKNRLRWRSDTFLMYLRNTFHTAHDHSKAMDLEITPESTNMRPLEDHETMVAEIGATTATSTC